MLGLHNEIHVAISERDYYSEAEVRFRDEAFAEHVNLNLEKNHISMENL
jgi:hypothetical protein